MEFKNKFTRRVWELKEGLIGGAIIGWLIGTYILPTQFDLNAIAQTQSALDFIRPITSNIIEFARAKLVVATTILGMGVGAFIDAMIPENYSWKKMFKRRS